MPVRKEPKNFITTVGPEGGVTKLCRAIRDQGLYTAVEAMPILGGITKRWLILGRLNPNEALRMRSAKLNNQSRT